MNKHRKEKCKQQLKESLPKGLFLACANTLIVPDGGLYNNQVRTWPPNGLHHESVIVHVLSLEKSRLGQRTSIKIAQRTNLFIRVKKKTDVCSLTRVFLLTDSNHFPDNPKMLHKDSNLKPLLRTSRHLTTKVLQKSNILFVMHI